MTESSPSKSSFVTPSFNQADFLEGAIQSVLGQKYPNLQYVIIDCGSNDGSTGINKKYETSLYYWRSKKDAGNEDAINKGFFLADGDVMAWINADDISLPEAFATIASALTKYDDIHWVKGITSDISQDFSVSTAGPCHLYSREWIRQGVYGSDDYFIQQDSVFWRGWLWKKTGGIQAGIKLAGDYFQWLNFAKLVPLFSIPSMVSCFRQVDGQLSQDSGAYQAEVQSISPSDDRYARKIRLFRKYEPHPGFTLKALLFRLLFGRQEYSAIAINPDGSMPKITGQRFDVACRL